MDMQTLRLVHCLSYLYVMSTTVFSCSDSAPFWGLLGMSVAVVFSNAGAAYGTAKSAVGIAALGMANEAHVMKNIIPVVMAGVLGIYDR
jgi:V-type H+-transporting ATPase proteolipid subunit